MEDLLSSYQRSALRLALRSFEESLQYSMGWVGSWRVNATKDPTSSLSEAQCQIALDLMAAAREEIASLRQDLKLTAAEENPCIRIQAEMTIARANLWDSRSKKLARFGRPAAGLAEALDPSLTHLADLANQLAAIFAERATGETRTQDGADSDPQPSR